MILIVWHRKRVYTQFNSPYPQLGEDQGAKTPKGNLSPCHMILLCSTPASATKEDSKRLGYQVKVNNPEQIV